MKRIFLQKHDPINFTFKQSREDFIVDEIATYSKAKKGGFVVLHIEKFNLSTMDMIKILQDELKYYNIGYAGLKDKYATTTQYVSLPIKYAYITKKLKHPQIKILDVYYSKKAIALGDLEGNRFKINLKDVSHKSAKKLDEVFEQIQRYGMPNYFGYQRFGKESSNIERARSIAHGEELLRDKKMQRLLANSYQSYLFNEWLAARIVKSEGEKSLKVLEGDILIDATSGSFINVSDVSKVKKTLKERKAYISGLLAGTKTWRAKAEAQEIEKDFDDLEIVANGSRRAAWIYPTKMRKEFNQASGIYTLEFILPKGAYATVLLENLANRDLEPKYTSKDIFASAGLKKPTKKYENEEDEYYDDDDF